MANNVRAPIQLNDHEIEYVKDFVSMYPKYPLKIKKNMKLTEK